MAIGGIYSTGTVSVSAGDKTAAFVGAHLSAVALQGDFLVVNGIVSVVDIVTDDTHVELAVDWSGPNLSNVPYQLVRTSWERYDPALLNAKVRELLATLDGIGVIYYVEGAEPDPALGEDGQFALKTNEGAWKFWLKVGGIWVRQGDPVGFAWLGSWSNVTNYIVNDIVSEAGTIYISRTLNVNKSPAANSNPANPARDWDVWVTKGDKGDTGTITIGDVVTGAPGSDASVVNSGTANDAILDITIPRGDKGDTGDAATVSIGDVVTGAPGSTAEVVNSGTSHDAILDITIPRGDVGEQGPAATISIGDVSTGAPGTDVIITNVGDEHDAVLDITIPRGDVGAQGEAATITIGDVSASAPGSLPTVVNSGDSLDAVLDFVLPRGDAGPQGPLAWAHPPVPWSTGLNVSGVAPATVVTFGNETYVAHTSHVTGPSFDATKFTKIAAKGSDGVGTGDMVGPAGSTDGHIVLFDGVDGKHAKDSGRSLADIDAADALAAKKAQNLADLADAAAARVNLGLGNVDNTSDATKNSAAATLLNKIINAASNTISNLTTAMFAANVVDNDSLLTANSSTRIPTQAAVKAYTDSLIAANDAMVFKGAIDCSTNPNYPAANAGWTYKVSVAGKIGGASGPNVEVGDTLLCTADGSAAGNHATVGANWNIVQANLDGAVIGPSSAVDGTPAVYDGTGGKLIKNITFAAFKAALALVKGDVGLGNVDNTSDATKNSAAATLVNKVISGANNTLSAIASSSLTSLLVSGFTATSGGDGVKSSGTYTPDPSTGNFKHITNGGAFTLAPPAGSCTLIVEILNNASAGAITTSGFTKVNGDALTTVNGSKFLAIITKTQNYSLLTIQALQ